jgi:hypothetical protein
LVIDESLSSAVLCGLEGKSINEDGGKDGDGQQKHKDAANAVFHGCCVV